MTISGQSLYSTYSTEHTMSTPNGESVQEIHAPNSICFGCGPANHEGLRIRSSGGKWTRNEVRPSPEHQAFPGMINGGIIGTLMDCHGNWTAAIALMDQSGDSNPLYGYCELQHQTS